VQIPNFLFFNSWLKGFKTSCKVHSLKYPPHYKLHLFNQAPKAACLYIVGSVMSCGQKHLHMYVHRRPRLSGSLLCSDWSDLQLQFTVMHLADAFIQSNSNCISWYTFKVLSVLALKKKWTKQLYYTLHECLIFKKSIIKIGNPCNHNK